MNRPGVGRDMKLSACPQSLQVGDSGTVELGLALWCFQGDGKGRCLSLPPSDTGLTLKEVHELSKMVGTATR